MAGRASSRVRRGRATRLSRCKHGREGVGALGPFEPPTRTIFVSACWEVPHKVWKGPREAYRRRAHAVQVRHS